MSKKKSLDVYLLEVFKEYIAIKDKDFKLAQEVFNSVFKQVKQKMEEQCNYFNKYSSQVLYAGSVYDGIKVSKMDEFDMDIVIRLPINYDDGPDGIIVENDHPGFVKLKITNAFDNLDKQTEWENCHKVTRDWRDTDKYLLQNKFRQWLHSIVQKALNELKGQVDVNGTVYLVTYKESGPAYTLNVRNSKDDKHFMLDVDLVPVIRFMHPRWPEGYREIKIEGSTVRDWLIVPKPNKAVKDNALKNRGWRLSFQDYERELMKGYQQLKMTIRLVKKLRDRLEMRGIASYYIKTLFLWELDKNHDKTFWRNKVSVCFKHMVEKFYTAIVEKNIPYFWHEDNNLIESLKPSLQKVYADKLKEVLDAINANDVDKVIGALLTVDEMQKFKECNVYKSHQRVSGATRQIVECTNDPDARNSQPNSPDVRAATDEVDGTNESEDKITRLELLVRDLEARLTVCEERLKLFEMEKVAALAPTLNTVPPTVDEEPLLLL